MDVIPKPETGWKNQAGRGSGRKGRRTFVRPVVGPRGRSADNTLAQRFHGVMVSTLDSESSDPSSNLGGT